MIGLRDYLNRLSVRWRRWRMLRMYADRFRSETGKAVGLTPVMAAYDRAERDGHLRMEDGDVVWLWPQERRMGGEE